jgi:tripartite-type tricarboxylate transporter receptor subunit TctC
MKAKLAHEGAEPVLMSAEEVNRFIRSEIAKFKKTVKERNIKPG